MPLNFPSNPSVSDSYTFESKTWTYNGTAWDLSSAASGIQSFTNALAIAAFTEGSGISLDSNGLISVTITEFPSLNVTNLTTSSTNSLGYFAEKTNVIASAFSANNGYSLTDGVVHYHTANASANGTVDLQGFSSIPVGNIASIVVMVTNGPTAYKVDTVQVDGKAANTIRWSGGIAPTTGYASNIDVYGFSVIKTATSTYTVLASQSNFG